jgi:hypothetical protein
LRTGVFGALKDPADILANYRSDLCSPKCRVVTSINVKKEQINEPPAEQPPKQDPVPNGHLDESAA